MMEQPAVRRWHRSKAELRGVRVRRVARGLRLKCAGGRNAREDSAYSTASRRHRRRSFRDNIKISVQARRSPRPSSASNFDRKTLFLGQLIVSGPTNVRRVSLFQREANPDGRSWCPNPSASALILSGTLSRIDRRPTPRRLRGSTADVRIRRGESRSSGVFHVCSGFLPALPIFSFVVITSDAQLRREPMGFAVSGDVRMAKAPPSAAPQSASPGPPLGVGGTKKNRRRRSAEFDPPAGPDMSPMLECS